MGSSHEQEKVVGLGIFGPDEGTDNRNIPNAPAPEFMQQQEERGPTNDLTREETEEWENYQDTESPEPDHAEVRSQFSDSSSDGEEKVGEEAADAPGNLDRHGNAAQDYEQRPSEHLAHTTIDEASDLAAKQVAAIARVRSCNPNDYYAILGLGAIRSTCNTADIEKAYHKLSLLTRPDENDFEGAEEASKLAKQAFEVLRERHAKMAQPAQEEEYDNDGEEPGNRVPDEAMPWNDIIAGEEDRNYHYMHRPRTPFQFYREDSKDEFQIWYWGKSHWGPNSERYWEQDQFGRPLVDPQNGRLFPVFPPGRARGEEAVPSRLRKARSVDDLSPETSPKLGQLPLWSPTDLPAQAGEDEATGDEAAARLTERRNSAPALSPSSADPAPLYAPSWGSAFADDEEADAAALDDFIRRGSTANYREEATDHITEHEQADNDDIDETNVERLLPVMEGREESADVDEPMPAVRRFAGDLISERSEPITDGSERPKHIAELTPAVEAFADEQEQITELFGLASDGEVLSEETDEPMPAVRPFAPAPISTGLPHERPLSRNDPPQLPDSPVVEEVEDESQTKPAPHSSGALNGSGGGDSPASPTTPQSASSVDSATGMTQREGFERATTYLNDPKPSLQKLRAKLKFDNPRKKVVAALPEDPAARIELLEAKVHELRFKLECREDQLKEANANLDSLEAHDKEATARYRDMMKQYRTAAESYNETAERFNELSQWADRAEEELADVPALKERIDQVEQEVREADENHQQCFEAFEDMTRKYKVEKAAREAAEHNSRAGEQIGHTNVPTIDAETQTDVDHSTQTARRPVADSGTQTLDMNNVQPANVRRRRNAERQEGPLLPPNALRWPAHIRDESARHIAVWVNAAHQAERGSQIDPLTPEQVQDIFGDGTTSFFELTDRLTQAGYLFRTDRFAQDIVNFMRDQGLSSIEAMYTERRLAEPADAVPRLLEEINTLLQDERHDDRLMQQVESNRNLAAQMEQQETDLKRCQAHGKELQAVVMSQLAGHEDLGAQIEQHKAELAQCHKHGEELQAEVETLKTLVEEVGAFGDDVGAERDQLRAQLEQLKSELQNAKQTAQDLAEKLTSGQDVDRDESNLLKAQLEEIQDRHANLQAAYDELIRTSSDIKKQLSDEQSRSAALASQLNEASLLNSRKQALRAQDEGSSNGTRSSNADGSRLENIRLQRRVKELEDQQSTHIAMLGAARDAIEAIEAIENTRVAKPTPALGLQVPQGPRLAPQQDAGLPALPRPPGAQALPVTPTSAAFGSRRSARRREIEADMRNSESWKQTQKAHRQRRAVEEQERAAMWELRRKAYKNLCGDEEIPYIPTADRLASLQRMAA